MATVSMTIWLWSMCIAVCKDATKIKEEHLVLMDISIIQLGLL